MSEWKKIKHLYLRAGFGLSAQEAEAKKNTNLSKEINRLLKVNNQHFTLKTPDEFKAIVGTTNEDSKQSMDAIKRNSAKEQKARKLVPLVNADWVKRMVETSDSLLEKMTLFWHGHFACHTKFPHLAAKQINTIRENALGNFRNLVVDVSEDPSMILYLNNQQNTKRKPNENFARELMELFTIGIGNYTEKDVKEAGRAFTGWRANPLNGTSHFIERRHDTGTKTFMGQTGNFKGTDIIDIILKKKETARFISRKIYRYFVNAKLNDNHVQQIANVFYDSDYDISKMMAFILKSNWFYESKNMGSKIKSPVELLVGMMKTLGLEFSNFQPILGVQKSLGQVLFNPPNVAGWPGDKAWIDNATLLTRLNLPALFLMAKNVKEDGKKQNKFLAALSNKKIDLDYFYNTYSNQSDAQQAAGIKDALIQTPLSVSDGLLYQKLSGNTPNERTKEILFRVMSTPEYQMC